MNKEKKKNVSQLTLKNTWDHPQAMKRSIFLSASLHANINSIVRDKDITTTQKKRNEYEYIRK